LSGWCVRAGGGDRTINCRRESPGADYRTSVLRRPDRGRIGGCARAVGTRAARRAATGWCASGAAAARAGRPTVGGCAARPRHGRGRLTARTAPSRYEYCRKHRECPPHRRLPSTRPESSPHYRTAAAPPASSVPRPPLCRAKPTRRGTAGPGVHVGYATVCLAPTAGPAWTTHLENDQRRRQSQRGRS
jgi:hypothetical protein